MNVKNYSIYRFVSDQWYSIETLMEEITLAVLEKSVFENREECVQFWRLDYMDYWDSNERDKINN